MKKQYIAPSVEIELYSVSAFCASCQMSIFDFTGGRAHEEPCLRAYEEEFIEDPAECYNAPYDLIVQGS